MSKVRYDKCLRQAAAGCMLVGLLLMVTGCAGPYTLADSGATVNLPIGEEFEVELKANRADGCRWTNVSEPSTAVEQVGAPEYQADNGEGTYVFHFKTRGAGDADIRLAYQRPDDGRRPPLRTFEMKVMVGTMGRIAEH